MFFYCYGWLQRLRVVHRYIFSFYSWVIWHESITFATICDWLSWLYCITDRWVVNGGVTLRWIRFSILWNRIQNGENPLSCNSGGQKENFEKQIFIRTSVYRRIRPRFLRYSRTLHRSKNMRSSFFFLLSSEYITAYNKIESMDWSKGTPRSMKKGMRSMLKILLGCAANRT